MEQKKGKPKTNLKLLGGGIAIGLVLMLAILLLLASAAPKPDIKVTAVNTRCVIPNKNMNVTCSTISGFNFSAGSTKAFNITLTAPSRYGEMLKSIKINDRNFSIVRVIPSLPQNISANTSLAFTVYINTSYKSYVGPISLSEIYNVTSPRLINVSMINSYFVNTNSSETSFSGSLQGFETSPGIIYFETFNTTNLWNYNENFTSIQTNTSGFSIVDVSPKLPVKIESGKSQIFTLQIKAPNSDYIGPLSVITYYNAPKPKYVNVTQLNAFFNDATTNMTYFSAALRGFNAFASSYELYTIYIDNATNATWLSFDTNTTGFKIVDVTPELPLKITNNQQAFTLRIIVPNYSYGGPISIIEHYKK